VATASEYYRLVKPGIVYGNSLHYISGVLFAASIAWNAVAAIGGLVGVMTIIASACIVNNYIDRDLDTRMKRTNKRASATRAIPVSVGITMAAILVLLGFASLVLTTNVLTVWLGIIAYVGYTFIYTLSKRYTVHHTLIGTIPGALPALAGYTALTNHIDLMGGLLFLLIALWQLPHFYAIGIYRRKEYGAAGVPLLTDAYSLTAIRRYILILLIGYVAVAALMSIFSLNIAGALIVTGGAVWWVIMSMRTWHKDADSWSRGVFFRSLAITLSLPVAAALNMLYEIFA
jgi:protoheme IX farnesyltransferase